MSVLLGGKRTSDVASKGQHTCVMVEGTSSKNKQYFIFQVLHQQVISAIHQGRHSANLIANQPMAALFNIGNSRKM